MDLFLKGICLFVCVSCVYGICDIFNCNVNTNSLFQACSEYTKTMNCMADQYDKCTGTAGQTEITLSVRAMHTPSDCAFSMHGMANSMTAQSKMYSSMMQKAPQGISPLTFPLANPFLAPTAATGTGTGNTAPGPAGLMPPMGMMPPPMMGMGDDMEMEGMGDMGDGPMEMMEDMMEDGRMMMPGMGGMFMPGMMGGFGGLGGLGGLGAGLGGGAGTGGAGTGGLPGGLMTSEKGKGGGAARFVDYRNSASGVENMAMQTIGITILTLLLSLL